jgi:hypothetical protein
VRGPLRPDRRIGGWSGSQDRRDLWDDQDFRSYRWPDQPRNLLFARRCETDALQREISHAPADPLVLFRTESAGHCAKSYASLPSVPDGSSPSRHMGDVCLPDGSHRWRRRHHCGRVRHWRHADWRGGAGRGHRPTDTRTPTRQVQPALKRLDVARVASMLAGRCHCPAGGELARGSGREPERASAMPWKHTTSTARSSWTPSSSRATGSICISGSGERPRHAAKAVDGPCRSPVDPVERSFRASRSASACVTSSVHYP